MSDPELLNNAEAQQYELWLDGRRASLASYRERGGVVVIPHTETDPAYGGRGLAGQLVRFALDDIRSRGRLVEPACPFVARYIEQHPEYADLLS
ncbi:MAG TPA: GNAT family N-acetyltransferase [Jatrophihabitans sp.]|nr:GNAT family N-acetyltransferase [Jatrophihabitans sp.]